VPAQDPLSQVFSALADPLRRDIVARLTAGDATVGELAAPYPVTAQSVSKHLRVLEAAGLVTRRREAQRRPVHLEAEVFDLMTMWIERHRREAEFRYRPIDEVLLAPQPEVLREAVVRPAPAPRRVARPDAAAVPEAAPAPEPTRPVRVDRVVVEERDTEPRTLRVRRGADRVFQPWDLQARAVPADEARTADGTDEDRPDDEAPTGGVTGGSQG
jgi:DNA-binding transcriptional ArsR family regulator